MHASSNTLRTLFVTVALLIGSNAGWAAGVLRGSDGHSVADAVQFAAGTFGSGVLLVLAVIGFWYGSQNREP
ncbi:hypothetical protein [Actinomadura montaniterrae]|uniref:Uncharacterized protein n=1 Tax=Actinomadura montaniterrae TaxID=1803903 RepID=A0A6L3VGE7_9ACTN|nr:hypothetical protein [Actinomadura montaniterrae]KAB2366749.1 hypothetical protein F9B16_39210 [Actinomadura montaniterrae]